MALNTHIICRLGHAFPKSTQHQLAGGRMFIIMWVGVRMCLFLFGPFLLLPEDANEDATADQDGTAGGLALE